MGDGMSADNLKTALSGTAARTWVVGVALLGLTACASGQAQAPVPVVAQVAGNAQGSTPVTPPDSPSPLASIKPDVAKSTVDELNGLIQSRKVAELRTAYNGTYGASLLFNADDMVYYAALFQQKEFWRVVRTGSEAQAEAAFRAFSAQSATLADVDIKRIKLQAEYNRSEKLLAARNVQLGTLQADQAVRARQEEQVASRQAQSRQEADQLADQQRDARQELRGLQRQIDALRAQQDNLSASLPLAPKKAPAKKHATKAHVTKTSQK
jgi:hypothetical protein